MKSKLVGAAFVAVAVAGIASAPAQTGAAARPSSARAPQTVVPYLSHGAGVWVERGTGRPVSRPGAAPATAGVHYAS